MSLVSLLIDGYCCRNSRLPEPFWLADPKRKRPCPCACRSLFLLFGQVPSRDEHLHAVDDLRNRRRRRDTLNRKSGSESGKGERQTQDKRALPPGHGNGVVQGPELGQGSPALTEPLLSLAVPNQQYAGRCVYLGRGFMCSCIAAAIIAWSYFYFFPI